jgi:hypothetical protein
MNKTYKLLKELKMTTRTGKPLPTGASVSGVSGVKGVSEVPPAPGKKPTKKHHKNTRDVFCF